MADAPVPVPLDPFEAETLFRAGETLCFVALPADRFVKTQWHGHEAMAVQIPFDDPETYFTAHPVALWDPAFVNPPRPTPPEEQTPTTIRAEVFTGGKIQNTPEPRVPVTLGDVVNLHAVLYDQNGAEMVPIEGITWESNNANYLTVEQLDLDDCAATMILVGNVSCLCRYANISGQINFAIAAPPVPPHYLTCDLEASSFDPIVVTTYITDAPAGTKIRLPLNARFVGHIHTWNGQGEPEGVGAGTLNWSSSNPAVANSTDQDTPNPVFALYGLGTCVITCYWETPPVFSWTLEVEVVEAITPPVPAPAPAATSEVIILPGASNKLAIGATMEAQTIFRDADGNLVAAPSPVAWSSSDETLMTVVADSTDSAKALVTAIAPGTATISSSTTAR